MLPNGQTWFIERMEKEGYKPDPSGVCFGLSAMGIQALLVDEIDIYNERLKKIYEIPVTEFSARLAQLKKQLSANPTENEIPAFLDRVKMYQDSAKLPELFAERESPPTQDMLRTSPLALSDKLKDKGGIHEASSDCGAFTESELKEYLESLAQALISSDKKIEENIGIIMANPYHTISIGFNAKENEWIFIDPQQMPARKIKTAEEMASLIVDAFTTKLIPNTTNKNVIINPTIISTKAIAPQLDKCISTWKNSENWQKKFSSEAMAEHKSQVIDATGTNLLVRASMHNDKYIDLIKCLLKANANSINSRNYNGQPLLYYAADLNYKELIKELVKVEGIDPNMQTARGSTALHAAASNGYTDIAKELLTIKGINVNCTNAKGSTPLLMAAENGYLDIVKALLDKNADVNQPFQGGVTPLLFAIDKGHVEVVKELLKHKDIDVYKSTDEGDSPISLAIEQNKIDIVKELLKSEKMDVNAQYAGVTALYFASSKGNLNAVNTLLDVKNIDVNRATILGYSPLLVAVQQMNTDIVQRLLQANADVNQVTENKMSALHLAVLNNDVNMVDLLLKVPGINPNQLSSTDDSPLSLAKENGYEKIAQLITQFNHNNAYKKSIQSDKLTLFSRAQPVERTIEPQVPQPKGK